MIKIKDFYMLCKWENLQNQQCIKCLFSPLHLTTFFPSTQLSMNMFGYSTTSFFNNDRLWLILVVEGVNDYLLDICQVSSLPQGLCSLLTQTERPVRGSGNLGDDAMSFQYFTF
ncbi:hypothetical protein AMECASPLE_018836 [Ameca splendens]|uniref:Uncharacterized protein n=1 Tax=Ameca splendens TaxID=208324 RepID=A0ABV0YPR2_9TELE